MQYIYDWKAWNFATIPKKDLEATILFTPAVNPTCPIFSQVKLRESCYFALEILNELSGFAATQASSL